MDGVQVRDLVNRFLNSKRELLNNDELSPRSFADYLRTSDRIVKAFGRSRTAIDLGPDDFAKVRRKLSKTFGPTGLGNEIQRIRTIFKWAFESELIDRPTRFGPDFKKPNRKAMRTARHANGQRMLEANEIRLIFKSASDHMKAMTLLGVNAGLGNTDIGRLPISALDLRQGMVDLPASENRRHANASRSGLRRSKRCKW